MLKNRLKSRKSLRLPNRQLSRRGIIALGVAMQHSVGFFLPEALA